MNKAVRTLYIMAVALALVFIIGRFAGWLWSDQVLWFAVAFLLMAWGIRFLGYMIRQDKLRKSSR